MIRKITSIAGVALCAVLLALPLIPKAEDIDIFLGSTAGSSANPNILIMLDNSANWSSASQGWPTDPNPPVACGNDCNKQGYYELKSIRNVIKNIAPADASVSANIGLMMFNNSNADRDGTYIRSHVRPMTPENRAALVAKIDAIIAGFNKETGPSSVQYGAAMWDVFKYFGGFTNPANSTTNTAPAQSPEYQSIPVFGTRFWGSNNKDSSDPAAYTGDRFNPVTVTGCANNYLIFIGNGYPAADDTTPNFAEVLSKLNDPAAPHDAIKELPVTNFITKKSCSAVSNSPTFSDRLTCENTLSNYPGPSTTTDDKGNETTVAYSCESAAGNKFVINSCTITNTKSGTFVPTEGRLADEYAKFLYRSDVNGESNTQNIITYTIDVFRNKQDTAQSNLLRNMSDAGVGGGKYFAASNEDAIVNAFKQILVEIAAVNTTFASASLPVNATNRAQNENQVFIGTFRPDQKANPRWFGNLKRYQLGFFGTDIDLADKNGLQAVNPLTGFFTACAASYWTTDSDNYWESVEIDPSLVASACPITGTEKFSDSPDGPMVEKGAAAQVLRTSDMETRNVLTVAGGVLDNFNLSNAPDLTQEQVNFIRGVDVRDESGNDIFTDARPSIHGDVIHGRPIPVNYDNEIVVYYGSNDGMYRAVEAETGKEKWSLVPPEFFSRLPRLLNNQPIVQFPGQSAGITPKPTRKDYFWDGSTGLFQNRDNSRVWIFPSMRRGGRMLYGLDVSKGLVDNPKLKWRIGCPNLTDNGSCTPGLENIGQTWSSPNVAFIKGFSANSTDAPGTPVIVVGGGYDSCEDEDTMAPSCASATGRMVLVINADTGAVIRSFPTVRSVAADVSLVDVDFDGHVDYAYAADTGGNIYRINFVDPTKLVDNKPTPTPLASEQWELNRVAFTNVAGRKFLFAPALLPNAGKIYLALGSGDREHPLLTNYPFGSVTNRFYVYVDDPKSKVEYNLDDTTLFSDYTQVTSCDTAKILPGSTKKGWFMDLNQYGPGEQTVTSALIVSGLVTFSTNKPQAPEEGSCSALLGEARGYFVNLLNASGAIGDSPEYCGLSRSTRFIGGGLPPSPVIGNVSINNKPYTILIGTPNLGNKQGTGDPNSPPTGACALCGTLAPGLSAQKRQRVFWKNSLDN